MSPLNRCRHCRTTLPAGETPDCLCGECCFFEADNQRYDALLDESYMQHQAKLMWGLADPPDPDDE